MLEGIKYTIAIPAYKPTFFKEALDSCVVSSEPDFEVIVLDDCSPYDIKSIVESIGDSRIRYFRNDVNVGAVNVVDNWNRCLDMARGKYFICMGDDDKLSGNALSFYSDIIGRYPGLGVYHGQTVLIDESSNVVKTLSSRPEWESALDFIRNRWTVRMYQYVGDFCYDTAQLKAEGGFVKFPLAWGSDDVTAVMMASGKGIANTAEVCFQYRINSLSISSTGNQRLKMQAVLMERKWYEDFLSSQPEEGDDAGLCAELKGSIGKHFDDKKVYTISLDLSDSFLRLFYWVRNSRRFGLSGWIFVRVIKCLLGRSWHNLKQRS